MSPGERAPVDAPARRRRLRLEAGALVALALGAGGVFAFLRLASYVQSGELHDIDERLLLVLRTPGDPSDPLGPPWFEELVRDFTALGGFGVLTLVTLAVTGYLIAAGRRRTSFVLLVAVAGGMATSLVLKTLFDRARPDLVPHGMHVLTQSFPSGHAMLAAVTYLTLGAMLARVESRLRVRVYALASAAVLAILVGASRVYLGVHWPSDVAAGWAVGAAFAIAVWYLVRALQRHGDIEP